MAWTNLTPSTTVSNKSVDLIKAFVRSIDQFQDGTDEQSYESARRKVLRDQASWRTPDRLVISAVVNILTDLKKQGWRLRITKGRVEGQPPAQVARSDERQWRRQQLIARRNEQLRSPSVREFVRRMETGHYVGHNRVSILSLMCDGRELADRVRSTDSASGSSPVKPYLQFVTKDAVCELTGFKLQDIWRYFRHGWSNPYESIPGRTTMFLVRDAAAKFHPIMGIAALGSAAVGLDARDRFIGWDASGFVNAVREMPTARIARWLVERVQKSIDELYVVDLRRDGLLPARMPRIVPSEVIQALREEAKKAREVHHRLTSVSENKSNDIIGDREDNDWEKQACTPLFRSKRSADLASLFELRNQLGVAFASGSDRVALSRFLGTGEGRAAVQKIVRIAKSSVVGTEIADLIVCGAIPPYNELLGGKLVAMLAISPEVIEQYRRRYNNTPSIIASSMAGRAICRPNHLVFVGTTSLYGVRPNQYDRIAIPLEVLGGTTGQIARYTLMDERTEGVGTFQFNRETRESITQWLASTSSGLRVNNVFGEGANPRLRALRDGLALLGYEPDTLLKHGQQRCIYGAKLIKNLRDYLIGLETRPKYLFEIKDTSRLTAALCDWWWRRWASTRSSRDDVLDRIKSHRLVHPIRHGARVILPEADIDQISLLTE